MRKIITLILAKVLLLSSFASFAAVNNNPQFEFGTIPAEDCQVLNNERGVTCDIKFQNTYDEEPLVFVMSTIDASMSNFSQKKTEYPSDLRVWSKSKTQATVKQLFPSHSAACKYLKYNSNKNKWQCNNKEQGEKVTFVDAPMEDIDYLVIEPGVIKFDGDAMIVAGKVSSNLTYSNIGGSTYRSKDVKFRNYGLNTQFASAPGVLVQLQTKNNYKDNQPLWLSSIALNPTTQGFSLILDRSEVTKNAELKHSEEVGFVAGLGQGFVNGRKFWLGDGSTRNTLGDLDDNVIKPITEGCLQVSDFPVSGFKSAPVLLASKRTRNGNNGGWLRRCSVTKTGVALINEEDMQKDSERGHVVEPFSYFLFDKPPVDDVCQLFPSPAQTWDTNTNGELVMSNNTLISGASLSNGKRYVGFKPGKITMHNNASCDNQSCLGDSGLMVQKQTLESFRSPQDPNLQNVIVSGKHGVGERTFNNNEIIGNLSVEETGTVYFESGTYWVGSININNAGKIIIPDGEKVTIHAKSVSISNNNSFFGELEGSELIVLVHDSQSSHVNFGNNTAFSGLLYSEVDVPLSNNVIVNGAITAKNIRMSNNAEIHATDNHCFTPSDNYEVTLSPVTQYALMCGTEQPSFEIETKNDGDAESTGVTVQVYPDADKFSVEVADSTGTGSYPSFTTSNVSSKLGKLKLQVTVTDQSGIELNDEYTLKVMVDNDPSKTQTSTFKFVPFKFDVDDQTIVAGKNYQIDTRVLACSDGQQTVVKSYTGSPSVQLEIETPADGRSDESLLTYEPKFIGSEQGKTSDTFKLMDSGLYTIKLEDANFTCDPQYSDGCPIAPDEDKGEQESVTLNGLFSVKSRPWKIAACNIVAKNGGKTNPATQATGDGFIASAESFNVTYKPVVHSDSHGNATNVCEYPLTQNYFSDSNTAAPLDAEFSVLYPSGGDIANLDPSKGSSLDFSSEEAKAGKTVEYVWDEVGSLNLKTKATYLGMELDEYDVTVGRFYPKYFKVVDSSWNYPGSQSFAYMNQPFDAVEFSVEALNANKAAIKNYAGFTTKAEFNLDDIDRYSGRFDAPDFGAGSWSNESDKSIGDFSISNSGQCIGSACWNKDLGGNYPDGPFNSVIGTDKSQIGLIYTYNADPVEFITDGDSNSRLVKQPDIRFGRVDLDDVGGNQGSTLHVPLRVEYWNGSRFIANPNDNQTDVKGVTASDRHIWPTGTDADPKAVTLGAGGEVSSGSSRSVTATQAEPYRQQTRVWLDLDDSTNGLPWLKYNWDNKNAGEENPSSVVTFGIHRGNDRVIYRGEPGLTGQ
ncbi:MSHA biogenesis protein MshQ [Vibrio parahaemolyticus]|uniref:DUF6701 domain-containing protein n=1 Tax=Vibrio parahaemolyticus TaxID=670 RepID=UPI00112392CD|nr:DUF6701 domain-containing protein [Vibrio parahaemolyticus]MBE3962896.1 MSHA biogenesis protein MshQ [Vibrio parahaemolyticus]MBE3990421.1 MSHA biogenesis protein MshQ [Vibrio parahaemolyticus]TOG56780.1 MSHA biogenesis protein MshQ [Vibrio parahaemolyticus]